ncbi:non-ribosomal peptide synthetase [Novosphingobium aerophilum]|uniref:Amino acid adenylation domain-containing protein n=1 Tax=Novosphingobium aerophilum TaxID=2839843 RepID=A0A7X1F7B0_9SPHN|nr:non-ribosomal peptide synthetase [Novosphingobium aerophilum]MBC2651747.1 amino acid adenylation domain-containing protein [Novosphingobium aerophilum]
MTEAMPADRAVWPLQAFLREVAAHHPDLVAIDVPPGKRRPARETITYAELDALSDRIARHLAGRITGEAIVALLLPRASVLHFAAQLGVLKAGGAYTCLDPAFPPERMGEIIEDADPVAVLTDAAGAGKLDALGLPQGLILDAAQLAAVAPPAAPLPDRVAPDRLAYVIYTSGTTGKPKGVMVEHRNIANLVASDLTEFGLGPGDRVVQGSSSAYDSSIEESWLALACGATLVVMDDDAARLGPDIIGWLQRERVTVFCPPPTLLRTSGCSNPAAALPLLRLLYVGGEALPRDLADLWSAGRRMVNGYGPTECAVTCVRGDVRADEPVTIGRAVPGMRALVLDEALNPVAEGERGELCMAGAGVARGYRNRPELTAEKFVDHPALGRIYRTGDLVHRDPAGNLHYHGRIDAQVKLRGYRIELGEIEARLASLPGVRAAGCRLQGPDGAQDLIAWIVPEDPAVPPALDGLRSELGQTLPRYMVPQGIGVLAELPTTVSGKLDRKALPELALARAAATVEMVTPDGEIATLLAQGMAQVLKRPDGVSAAADFFEALGGDSLTAALLVTRLRQDARTDWITVSDIYEARTVQALARLAERAAGADSEDSGPALQREGRRQPLLTGTIQTLWLLAMIYAAAWGGWVVAFQLLPRLFSGLGLIGFILLMPVLTAAGFALYLPLSVGFAVGMKRLLIGRYRAIRTPYGSSFYARHWLVFQASRLIPWAVIQGTGLQIAVLRALGATIGERVHLARGVELRRGGWDLLTLGDGAAVNSDAVLGLIELDRGDLVIAPVTVGAGAVLETRAGLSGGTSLGAGARLAALSVLNPGQSVPAGELWRGVPAERVGPAPAPPVAGLGRSLSPLAYDTALLGAEAALALIAALPAELFTILACHLGGVGIAEVWRWIYHPTITGRVALLVLGLSFVSVPLTLVWTALLSRWMGRVRPGTYPRWSPVHLRVWLKTAMLRQCGEWLSGTVFWSRWLRLAGMDIGPKCEVSTIIDVVPELVTIGAETFFADGIYLGCAEVQDGVVTLAHTTLGRSNFLGNHAVVPAGEVLPDNVLFGIATVARGADIRPGGARFGLPSFDLPRREVVEVDRSLTHDPSAIRYANRVFWELLRFALPLWPLLLGAAWYAVVNLGQEVSPLAYALIVLPAATLLPLVALCLGVIVLKWLLIGRVKPGQHALWSCWCSRWDFVYVAWQKWANAILQRLEGTWLLPWYLRAVGLRIGRNVVLGPEFAQVVDPDMITIEDGATASPNFQAHTFEDRVLKVDHVRIGKGATVRRGTVPLYGAVIGERTHVGPHSVIMKQEHLLPGKRYQGIPTRVYGTED